VLLTGSAAQAQDATTTWIEGHVFNKWTGVPLQNVVIQVGPYRPPRPGPGGGVPRDYTDANGFYSIDVHGQQQEITLTAACFMPPRPGEPLPVIKAETTALLRPGTTLRRDLYIAGPRRRTFDYCRLVDFPR
jgi:hypothetical protein